MVQHETLKQGPGRFGFESRHLCLLVVWSCACHLACLALSCLPGKVRVIKLTHQAALRIKHYVYMYAGDFPAGTSGKQPTCQSRRCGFDLWVGKIPWRRAWQPTPVFLPGESHGQRSLVAWWATVHRVTKSRMWLNDLAWHGTVCKTHSIVPGMK